MARWLFPTARSVVLASLLVLGSASLGSGCAAVFPEIETRLSEAPQGVTLDPPPPADRMYLDVVGAKLPPRTRDGREWKTAFGNLPSPYVRLKVNGGELLRTVPVSDTLEPVFEKSPKGNFKIAVGDTIEVELWISNFMNDTPIGRKKFTLTQEQLAEPDMEVELDGESTIQLKLGPARAIWGAGFWFELRSGSSYVTRVIEGSPAARAGIQRGDRIVAMQGKPVDQMSPDEVRSVLGSFPAGGLAMQLEHPDGATLSATVKEGPIYPLYEDAKRLPIAPK